MKERYFMRNVEDITESEFETIFEENAMVEAKTQNLSELEGLDLFEGADEIRDREQFSRRTYDSLCVGGKKVSERNAVISAHGYVGGYKARSIGYL